MVSALKSDVLQSTVGSNPTLSANTGKCSQLVASLLGKQAIGFSDSRSVSSNLTFPAILYMGRYPSPAKEAVCKTVT